MNTDNASRHDCGLRARVEVVGMRGGYLRKTCICGHKFRSDEETSCPECHRDRQGVDTRKSCFEVELPDQQDENCEVCIVEKGHRLAQLARMGAMLCVVKGVTDQVKGAEKGKRELIQQGKMTIAKAKQIMTELEAEIGTKVPNVTLPGGVTLKHALACVEVCRRLGEGNRSKN